MDMNQELYHIVAIKRRFVILLAASFFTFSLAACDIRPPPLPQQTATVAPNPSATITANAEASPTPPLSQATAEPTSEAVPTTGTASGGRIIYLDPDGFTVKSVLHDGTSPRTEAVIQKNSDQRITTLSADPTGQYLVYTVLSKRPEVLPVKCYLLHY